MSNGKEEVFEVYETPLIPKASVQNYSNIKSYTGKSIKNPSQIIKFTLTDFGFHGMIFTPEGEVIYINPEDNKTHRYEVFSREALEARAFECQVQDIANEVVEHKAHFHKILSVNDGNLRTFRLALAATAEYTQYHANAAGVGAGTDAERRAAALAAMTVTMTRVNGIFERDLGITMELVPNESIIFLNSNTDGLSNNDGGSLINEIQSVIDANIGHANYDIGHVFSTGGGGIAQLNSPCTSSKARGVTGLPNPVGDPFDVDYVAHEMGHQYGATHTFNNSCGGNRSGITAVEPGSGTTIMSYAGICPPNIQSNVNPYFHAVNIQQMWENLSSGNSTCAALTPTGNAAPTADAGNDYTIPVSTPFILEGQATDADGDILTYCWEQTDTEIAAQPPVATSSGGPLFRSFSPDTSPNRYFPSLPYILTGNLSTVWEVLPQVSRELNFSLLVRDNNAGGGQTARDDVRITTDDSSGPFTVTSQPTEETWVAGEVQTITWDVANTDLAPINAAYVSILLYTDTQFADGMVLSDNVVNDGSHDIIVPGGIDTATARIMVRPVNNIFFAVNAANISITQSEFVLTLNALEQTACQPNDAMFDFTYMTYLGFSDVTDFTATGVPAGLAVSFNPPSAMNNDTNVDVTVTNTGGIAEGNYTFTIQATSGAIVKEYEIDLAVYDDIYENVTLTAPADMTTGTSLQPQLQWQTLDFTEQYEIEISEVPDFSTVVESAVIRQNHYTPAILQDETPYYWRVKPLNSCGEGSFSDAFSFTTTPVGCKTFANNNTVTISDIGLVSITSSIVILEDITLNDLAVNIDISHTYVGDLRATLTSPSGTMVNLFSNLCGSGDNADVTFDDEGDPISCGASPLVMSGTVRPEQQLSAFNGESAQGEWILTIYDDFNADGGSLNSFSLDMCVDGFLSDFLVQITGETCVPNDDGKITLKAYQELDYQATLTGFSTDIVRDFTDETTFSDLPSGEYTLCVITGGDSASEKCYDIVITEPEALVVQSKVNVTDKTITVAMEGGTFYNVVLNGISTQTTASEITLDLKDGINTLKITTNKACQGSYEEDIRIGDNVIIYPNPITDSEVTINLTNHSEEKVTVRIYSISGRLLYDKIFQELTDPIPITIVDLPSGVYLLDVQGKHIKTTQKIVKL